MESESKHHNIKPCDNSEPAGSSNEVVWERLAASSLQQKQDRASKEKNPTGCANPSARRSQVAGSSLDFNSFPSGSRGDRGGQRQSTACGLGDCGAAAGVRRIPNRPLKPTKIPCQTQSYIFGGQIPTTSIPR